MPHKAFQLAVLGLLLTAAMVGCTHTAAVQDTQAPAVIPQQRYEQAFQAGVHVLRDQGFRVARNDYRFGVITSYPEESPTLAEPWVGLNSTRHQARRSTLNAERRVVTVTLKPSDVVADDATQATPYDLAVEVEVQRLRDATRYLTHSATGYISSQYAAVPMHLADRGVEAESWETIGRDAALEQRLTEAIVERAMMKGSERQLEDLYKK